VLSNDQEKVGKPCFHFALREGGFLCNAGTIGRPCRAGVQDTANLSSQWARMGGNLFNGRVQRG
jgi:hypothetical protein